ncbi:hypothetical protein [Ornithinimicrobium murale]|uniref:hypothetical protein n=1 Tax=Ornithinimicrobium murale TaxID=1050153 RepID=UPI000E0CD1ED|nr:hypothetical protein [Ornithinimicrobium murale]
MTTNGSPPQDDRLPSGRDRTGHDRQNDDQRESAPSHHPAARTGALLGPVLFALLAAALVILAITLL